MYELLLLDVGCTASNKAIQVTEMGGRLVCRVMLSSKKLLVREAPFPVTRFKFTCWQAAKPVVL